MGTILTPRNQEYEKDWENTDFYSVLEHYRPMNKPAHKNSVFMVTDPDDVDLAGGGTEWLMTVKPLGPVSRHDLNWSSEISMLLSDGHRNAVQAGQQPGQSPTDRRPAAGVGAGDDHPGGRMSAETKFAP